MAKERLLGADHQEAHNVVVDAGESLHLGLSAVPAHGRGLYGARSLLVGEELIHELAHAHRGADGSSLVCILSLGLQQPFLTDIVTDKVIVK